MANRMKEQTGWCDHCKARRLVRRRDAFFQSWRCTVCGTSTADVGEQHTAEREVLYAQGGVAQRAAFTGVIPWLVVLCLAAIPVIFLVSWIAHAVH